MDYPERVVPAESLSIDYLDHLARYRHAQSFAADRNILDCGCGSGYGSYTLAETARTVTGVDIAAEAVAYDHKYFARPNLRFLQMDSLSLAFAANSFDLVCSFEVIEHVADCERYLQEIRRVLQPNGAAMLSTPNRLIASPGSDRPLDPYHLREFTVDELRQILASTFSEIEIWGEFEDSGVQMTKSQMRRWRSLWHALDRWGLRRYLPSGLRRRVLSTAVKASGAGDFRAVSERNMTFAKDKLETASNFLVVVKT